MMDWSRVPVHYMADAVERYVEQGVPPGSFLTALMSNDLIEAFRRADDNNTAAIRDWVVYMLDELPAYPWRCYGSADAVRSWIAGGGLNGLRARQALEKAEDE